MILQLDTIKYIFEHLLPFRVASAPRMMPCPPFGSFKEASVKANERVVSPTLFLSTEWIPTSVSAGGRALLVKLVNVNVATAAELISRS
jgi:hypothetical protein